MLQPGATPSCQIEPLIAHFKTSGYDVSQVRVPYESQRGGNRMLRIKKAGQRPQRRLNSYLGEVYWRCICLPSPAPAHIDDFSGRFDGIKHLKGFVEHSALLIPMMGFSQRMSEWPSQENRSGRLDLFGIRTIDGNTDGGDTRSFDDTLDQSHGLMANPSSRCQQDHIHF